MDNKYVLVSFDDERMKSISEVLGNNSCKKILNFLAEKRASETDISRELAMPLNTVGYNIKKLLETGLIETDKHWWSVKGKKIPVYRVSNKSIVISPKQTRNSLKLLPVLLITGLAALVIRFFTLGGNGFADNTANAPILASESGASAVNSASSVSLSFVDKVISLQGWSWFLIGALFALAVYFVFNFKKSSGRTSGCSEIGSISDIIAERRNL